ncbi:MAG: phosphate transporter permease PstA [Actinomycetota bacterium]|jgi:phosphate transport system permease protein
MKKQLEKSSIIGKSHEKTFGSVIFLGILWLCLLIASLFLLTLFASLILKGMGRFDLSLFGNYNNTTPEDAGARAAILGTLFVVGLTAVMTIPVGIMAAIYLEEFADKNRWFNRMIELNIQNLSAVPAILFGMLTLGLLDLMGFLNKNIVFGGALALSLLILPVIILTTREALRAVPQEIRAGSLALGATDIQTVARQTLPAAVPGIATGTILAISRAIGEAAPLLLLGALVFITYDPNGLTAGFTTMPIQIFGWSSAAQDEFKALAAAASVLLLVILVSMNGLAIFIRNRFAKQW